MRPSVPDVHITDPQDAELAAYRPLCGLAVVGLIFGLLSPLAMADPVLWLLVTLPGVIINWLALRRIRSATPPMSGRVMALAGALLSLVFLAAAPAERIVHRKMVQDEARQFAMLWFRYLAQDEPHKAHQLTVAPQSRRALNSALWNYYQDAKLRMQLEGFVSAVTMRTLLALGPKAQVRFYQTVDQSRQGPLERVDLCYAVTYDEQGEKKSFFVLAHLLRQQLASGRTGWRFAQAEGGYRPEGW